MSSFNHPGCAHPQPHCPYCDCTECFYIAQRDVRRNSDQSPAIPAAAAGPNPPLGPITPTTTTATLPAQGATSSSWLSTPSSRFVLFAGVAALSVGLWLASHRRSHRLILQHRFSGLGVPPMPPTSAASSQAAGMGQYEAGFLKGSEVTAAMYRAMHNSAADAWRSQLNGRGWCRYRGY